MADYYVYIMTNPSRTLYVGVTNDLERRVAEHKSKSVSGFTTRYNVTELVFYELGGDIEGRLRGRSKSRDGGGGGRWNWSSQVIRIGETLVMIGRRSERSFGFAQDDTGASETAQGT